MTTQTVRSFALSAMLALAPLCALAVDAPKAVEPVKLADRIYTFSNTMANSTAIVGDESVILVDSGENPQAAAALQAAIATLTPKPVRVLVNTHWHFDHANGNEALGAAGVVVVAQKEVRPRMIAGKGLAVSPSFPTLAYGKAELALPTVTFDRELTLCSGDEEVQLVHPAAGSAHTDGDTVVYYRHANIVQTGDLYFEGVYPYIDVATGGWIDGMIAAAARSSRASTTRPSSCRATAR